MFECADPFTIHLRMTECCVGWAQINRSINRNRRNSWNSDGNISEGRWSRSNIIQKMLPINKCVLLPYSIIILMFFFVEFSVASYFMNETDPTNKIRVTSILPLEFVLNRLFGSPPMQQIQLDRMFGNFVLSTLCMVNGIGLKSEQDTAKRTNRFC